MKSKIKQFLLSWKELPALFPAEMGLSVLFLVCTVLDFETENPAPGRVLHYAPILFFLTFSLNIWQKSRDSKRWKRIVYWLSSLVFIPVGLVCGNIHSMSFSNSYTVTLFILLLFTIVNSRPHDNRMFMQRTYQLIGATLSALVLSCIAYLLFVSIYQAVYLLFDLQDFAAQTSRFYAYAQGIVFGGWMVNLFLFFNSKEEIFSRRDKMVEILFRFILVPALLVYTAIFYLYIVRIVISGSLPQQSICSMAIAFIFSSYLLKGMKLLQQYKAYDLYFRYISWINLPTLLLYWFSAAYRINEYGWTEARVYLVVFGLIMTCLVVLFLRDREHQFMQSGCVAVVLLGLVTYIPGISAKDIERYSQTERGEYLMEEVKRENIHVNLFEHSEVWNIERYKSFEILSSSYSENEGDSVTFSRGDSVVLSLSKAGFIKNQLRKYGLEGTNVVQEKDYSAFLRWETDSALILFEHIGLYRETGKEQLDVKFYGSAYYFKK